MTYQSFETWFDTVRELTPVPITPNDHWYDAYLYALDPQQAVCLIQPAQAQGRLRSLWSATKMFFNYSCCLPCGHSRPRNQPLAETMKQRQLVRGQ